MYGWGTYHDCFKRNNMKGNNIKNYKAVVVLYSRIIKGNISEILQKLLIIIF